MGERGDIPQLRRRPRVEIPRSLTPLAAVAVLAGLLWRLPPGDSYTGYAFAGSGIIFLFLRRSAREVVAATALTPVVLVTFRLLHAGDPGPWLTSLGVGFGGASGIVAAMAAARSAERETALRRLAAIIAMPAFVLVGALFISSSAAWHPATYDGLLAAIDRSFGFDPSSVAGAFLAGSVSLTWACKIVYESLPMAICLAAATQWGRDRELKDAGNALWCTIAAALFSQLIFQLVPACGPRFLWGPLFPFSTAASPPPLHPVSVAPGEFRNAFPSLHMTGALYVMWAVRSLGTTKRALAWTYAAFTVVATLGSGQHYLVDLLVAVPFAVSVQLTLARREPLRLALALGLVGLWISLVRWGTSLLISLPPVTFGLAAASIGIALVPGPRERFRTLSAGSKVFNATLDSRASRSEPSTRRALP